MMKKKQRREPRRQRLARKSIYQVESLLHRRIKVVEESLMVHQGGRQGIKFGLQRVGRQEGGCLKVQFG